MDLRFYGGGTHILTRLLIPIGSPFRRVIRSAAAAIPFALCIVSSSAQELWSQGSGRPSLAGVEAAAARQRAYQNMPYNLQLGSAHFNLSADLRTEFNDNTNLSQNNPESDILLVPRLRLNGIWPITKNNDLNFSLGIGSLNYMIHNKRPDSNTVLIDPDSNVNFDVFIGDSIRLNFHDKFLIRYDPIDQATLSNVRNFGRFENTAGVTSTWDMNDIVVRTTYDHYNYVSLTGTFNYLNRNAEILRPSVAYALTDKTTVGVENNTMYSYYSEDYLNDSTMVSVGPWATSSIGQYLKVRAAGGFQGGYFSHGGASDAQSNINGWYANLTATHRTNSWLTQTLMGGHEYQLGLNSNYETIDYVRYYVNSTAIRDFPTKLYGFFEHVEDSPAIQSETLNRFGVGIHVEYQVSSKLSVGIDYQFIRKDSNLPNYDYTQDRVFITTRYQF